MSEVKKIINCGDTPLSFFQMLASCLVEVDGVTAVNTIGLSGDCEAAEAALSCDANVSDPERLVVANAFGIDECGRPALKIFIKTEGD